MLLRKEQGGCSIGEYTWATDGAVVEVPVELGTELLAIRGAGFSVAETEPAASDGPDPDAAAAVPAAAEADASALAAESVSPVAASAAPATAAMTAASAPAVPAAGQS